MGKKILVTGADGFIGSHLVENLVRKGYEVKAFTLYNSFNSYGWLDTVSSKIIDSIELYAGDVRDPHGVKNAVKGCDLVMHLAALIGIPYSYYSPDSYVETNVKGTLNIVQAARELGVEKVIHTSTSEVYGTAQYVPINEDHPLCGQSPYSATKIGADQVAYSFFSSFNLPVTIVRPFNTYGPRQSARAIIPTLISQMVDGVKRVKVGATHPTRDFNYILDTVNGFIAAAESEKSTGEVINLSSNYEISIGELIELVASTLGVEVEIETDKQRLRPEKSEVERLWGDNKKAQELIGWSPSYAGKDGLARGLKETAEWFKNPDNIRRYDSGRYII